MAVRKRELTPDAQDRFRPYLGWKQTGDGGKYVQHRFNLGRDREQAEQSMIRLRQLWQHIDANHQPTVDSPKPTWDSQSLWIAEELAQGKVSVILPRKPLDNDEPYARYFHRVQRHYPFINFLPENHEQYEAGARANLERVEQEIAEIEGVAQQEVEQVENKALKFGNLPRKSIAQKTETLHKALDAHAKHIRQTKTEKDEQGEQTLTAHGKYLVDSMDRFKEHHENVPLSEVDFDAIQEMVNHWRNRPLRKGTERPIKARSAENHIKVLKAFFRWVHRTKKFTWRKPEDFDDLDTRVQQSTSEIEDRATTEQVETYSIEELKMLYEYATPIERCLILLGLNCGFAPSEQGTLRLKHLALRQEHSSAEKLGWKTSAEDSFIKKLRNKTKVYGEWFLWDHTVKAMDWLVARHREQGHVDSKSLLLMTATGRPFYRLTGGGNRSQKFASIWSSLTRRVQKDSPDFPELSFGKLKKTGGNMVRRLAGGEIHSVYICHGKPVKTDSLAELYSNRPFAKTFETLREIEHELQPLWDAVPNPFGRYTQQYTPLGKVKRIRALYEDGVPVAEIAKEVGVSKMTVYRHTKDIVVPRTRRRKRRDQQDSGNK